MKYENVAYLCDGEGCSRMCARDPEMWKKHTCHHTLDENHARNKSDVIASLLTQEMGSGWSMNDLTFGATLLLIALMITTLLMR